MTEESSESNSTSEMSMCSFASQLSEHSEETYKEEYYVINDLQYKKDKESFIFKVLYAEKTESYDKDDENSARDIVTVNHDLINSKPYTSMGIYCQGAFQLFDFSNLYLVTKSIHKVSVVEGIIDLSLLKGSIQCLKLTNCSVRNIWNPEFHCEELQVTSRDGDISWLQHVKCERIKWQYLFVDPNYDLLKMNYDNLVNVSFEQTDVDLSQLHLTVAEMQIQRCSIQNQATKYLIVECLLVRRSILKTQQLINAKITTLKLENIFQGFKTMREYFIMDYYNPTIINELPDVQTLMVDHCQFNLKSFSSPLINSARIIGTDLENIPFKFFQNIKNVIMKESKYLNEFKRINKLNQIKTNTQQQEIVKLRERTEQMKQIIPKIENKLVFLLEYILVSPGDE
ncbi:Hypothetical_protein [Hexamita inflata]|uniref:Hypothetical_protein n=1 Tax=Hexamita inflata TaxID=28002 RepID=A0AA86UM07_9EUKA|nr:Hypothetical protein HINF_LOCUS44282 [Hexamita inflata]